MGKLLKIVLVVLSIPLIIFFGFLIFITTTETRPAFIHLPTELPSHITMQKVYIEFVSGGYGIEYAYLGENALTYIVENADSFQCNPPNPNDSRAKDYLSFIPLGSDSGCVVTVNKNGLMGRVYRWKSGLNQFGITSINLSITDDEIKKIADSIKPKVIFIQQQSIKLKDGSIAHPIKD